MSLLKTKPKPIAKRSTEELEAIVERGREMAAELRDPAVAAEVGRGGKRLADAQALRDEVAAARAELAARKLAGNERTKAMDAKMRRAEIRGGRGKGGTLRRVLALGDGELSRGGLTFDAARLSDDDDKRLSELVGKRERGEALSARETATFEKLVGKALGDEGWFKARRAEEEMRQQADALAEGARLERLPKRVRWEEPGSITLPAYVFKWLSASAAKGDGSWTLADTGVLTAMLFTFANASTELIGHPAAEFTTGDDGELTLELSGSLEDFAIRGNRNTPGPEQTHVRALPALITLRRNGWIETERVGGTTLIRLGPKALALAKGSPASS